MDKLEEFVFVFLAMRQQHWQPRMLSPHSSSAWAVAQWSSSQSADHVVLHTRTSKDMRAQNVRAALPQAFRTISNDLVALPFMDCVGQRMRRKREVLLHRSRSFRTVSRHAAGENKLANVSSSAVHDADGFHDAGRAGNVDLPHTFHVENAGALRIDNERQVHH